MDFSSYFKNKIILVTGGTGTIGSEIVSQLLKFNPKTIRIFSNSENELWEAKFKFQDYGDKLRFLLGDLRNFERIRRASQHVDYIFNAAAIKHVPISEYNPMEAINVNIHGLENLIEAAYLNKVKKLIHISTDKAVNPTTVMGATKMLGERLLISREMTKGKHLTIISCVRFGNVLGSRGSIIPLLKEQIKKSNSVTLTDERMKRFFLSITQAVELVIKSTILAKGGEIFVLKMPIIIIKDLIEVVISEYCKKINLDPKSIEIKMIGPRPGEKLDEELISPVEFASCYEIEDMFIIYPITHFGYDLDFEETIISGSKKISKKNFIYNTENSIPLSKDEIKKLLFKYNLI
ncbi:MAG: SDR family NAD(P)-dependent oxidoreductase [Promethearchaeota archaeon]